MIDALMAFADTLVAMMTNSAAVTAATNAVWGGVGFLMALGMHWLVRYRGEELPSYVLDSLRWGRLPGVCVWLHRTYWNLAIFLRPEGGAYHPGFLEHKSLLLVLVIGIAVGTLKAVLPFVSQTLQPVVLRWSVSFLAASAITAAYLALP